MRLSSIIVAGACLSAIAAAAGQTTVRSKATDWFATSFTFTNVSGSYSGPWIADYKHWIGTEPGAYTLNATANYPAYPTVPNAPAWANVRLAIPSPVTTLFHTHLVGKCQSDSTWQATLVQRGAALAFSPGVDGWVDADSQAGLFSGHTVGAKTRFTDPWTFALPPDQGGVLQFWTDFDSSSYASAPAASDLEYSGHASIERAFTGRITVNNVTTTVPLMDAKVGTDASLFGLSIGPGVVFADGGTVPDKLAALLSGLNPSTATWQLSTNSQVDLSAIWTIPPQPFEQTIDFTWFDLAAAVHSSVPAPSTLSLLGAGIVIAGRRHRARALSS